MEFIKINGKLINTRYIVTVQNIGTSVLLEMSTDSQLKRIDVNTMENYDPNEKISMYDSAKRKFDEIEIALTPDPLQVEIMDTVYTQEIDPFAKR